MNVLLHKVFQFFQLFSCNKILDAGIWDKSFLAVMMYKIPFQNLSTSLYLLVIKTQFFLPQVSPNFSLFFKPTNLGSLVELFDSAQLSFLIYVARDRAQVSCVRGKAHQLHYLSGFTDFICKTKYLGPRDSTEGKSTCLVGSQPGFDPQNPIWYHKPAWSDSQSQE